MANERFRIRRENMLKALRLPAHIPLGQTDEWENVEVATGRDGDEFLTLPKVRLKPHGVANRIQVLCPCCRQVWVRFSVLQQHAGTKECERQGTKRMMAESDRWALENPGKVMQAEREDRELKEVVQKAVPKVWGQIQADAYELGDLTLDDAVELCLDADRPVTMGGMTKEQYRMIGTERYYKEAERWAREALRGYF